MGLIQHLKAMVVVVVLAWGVFAVARPMFVRFMSDEDFCRRRNIWLILTISAFVSPSFWLWLMIAVPTLLWGGRSDRNPAALYVMMLNAVPYVSFQIPVAAINQLFDLTPQRILSFALLVPAVLRIRRSRLPNDPRRFDLLDGLVLGFLTLTFALELPHDSVTNAIRRGFLILIDTAIVYYVFSRIEPNRKAVIDVMAALVLSSAVMAPMAVFENLRGWLLYQGIGELWGSPNPFAYLLRGSSLRSQVSAGHTLTLGYVLAIGFGFTLYLRSHIASKRQRWTLVVTLWLGLLATLSRGPWLTAVLLLVVFLALNPRGVSGLFKALAVFGVIAAAILQTPLGDTVIAYLPFVGNVDSENVTYRQQLFETALLLIPQNPLFGDPFVLRHMEHLRQGQGIIDLINGYVAIALFYGIVGLCMFAGVLLVAAKRTYGVWSNVRRTDPDLALVGASLLACMVATMFFIATASYGTITYVLVGVLASYSRLRPQLPVATPAGYAAQSRRWAAR